MATLDLPAHSVTMEPGEGFGILVGGPEALATTDTATYAVLDNGSRLTMYSGGDPGFGWITGIDLSAVTAIDIVALCYRDSSTPGPPGYDIEGEGPHTTYPTLYFDYIGGYPNGANIDGVPVGDWGWVSQPLLYQDWFRFLSETLPEDQGHLSPAFKAGPYALYFWQPAWADYTVHLAYLAARITYTSAEPPRRQFPRDDGLTGGTERQWPLPQSQQKSVSLTNYL